MTTKRDHGRIGERTLLFSERSVGVISAAGVAGKLEAQGKYRFDHVIPDALNGEKTFELSERRLLKEAVERALQKAGLTDVELFIGGDLLNQIVSAGYAARDLGFPFLGVYGACSTMAEALLVGAVFVDGSFAESALCATSSHFGTAERQFRGPLELGTPKTPTSQNTATASGAMLLGRDSGTRVFIKRATIGRVVDFGITESSDMGSAMAPAAAETLLTHFADTGLPPEHYDLIVTGDLGTFGSSTMHELIHEAGLSIPNHMDCGATMYEGLPDMNCGASGCGCGASVLCGNIISRLMSGELERVLFTATGALLSPTVVQQGETIPGIAHSVALERA